MLFSLFPKPKDSNDFEQKCGLVCQNFILDCNAMHVGEMGCNVRIRKWEHVDAVKTINTKKSALSLHVMDFNHQIDWDNFKLIKSLFHVPCCRKFFDKPKGLFVIPN